MKKFKTQNKAIAFVKDQKVLITDHVYRISKGILLVQDGKRLKNKA